MTTQYVTIKGYIRDGKLNVELPDNVVDGEVEVKIPIPAEEDKPLTEAEIRELMTPNPKTIGEILEELKENNVKAFDYELDGAIITRMMRVSIWDVFMDIMRDVKGDKDW
ncbi:MAG: hypothetical protein HZC41_09955 [Chloroflexi bacterium]|nr:hypothetical protein [Chloroflexota bacterium]